jgi:TolB-like protein/Tfp pilus assembly protein PilF
LPGLSERLKERRVAQWGLAYLGAAWLGFQILDALREPWNIPDGFTRAITVLLVLGFLVTLVLAWYHGEKGRQRVSGPELLILAGIAFCAGILLTLIRDDAPRGAEEATAVELADAIAILPLADRSPDGDSQYFGDGIADEIISTLSRTGLVRVMGRSSSFALRDQPATEVGRRLGVAHVLEGSFRTEGDNMRIDVSLVDASDGFERWSRQFDRSTSSLLQVQREIAAAVVAELTGEEMVTEVELDTLPAEAADLYFQARAHWIRRTEPDLHRALDLFQEASEIAPGFAPALAGQADAYAVMGFYQYLPPEEAFPATERLAAQALELDPDLADAIAAQAYADLYYNWDWEQAERGFRQAIEADPGYSVAHQWYGNLLVTQRRFIEAEDALRQAVTLEPLSTISRAAVGWGLFYARRYDQALADFDAILQVDPGYYLAHYWKGWVLQQTGRVPDAIRELERAAALSDSTGITLAALAGAYARAGRTAESTRLRSRLADPARTPHPPLYELGKAFLAAGDRDTAFRWFERAFRERANQLVFIAADPEMDPVRDDPRYQDLVERLGLN